jgi:glycosyltransferase involved in cell wall biosynthesis
MSLRTDHRKALRPSEEKNGKSTGDTCLLITTSYPTSGDGSEAAGAFVADFAEALSEHAPVRVLAPGGAPGHERSRGSLQVHRFAAPGRPLSLLSPSDPRDWPAIYRTLASLRREALAVASDGGVAHSLALWALPSGWAAATLQRRYGIPYSVWALGSDIWSLGRLPGARTVLRRVLRDASACFADGLQLAAETSVISGRPCEFMPSTRRLISVPRTHPMDGRKRLVYLGRWHPNKGVDLLLAALKRLSDPTWLQIADVHIAGGGPLEAEVRLGVAELRACGRPVRQSGFLAARDAAAALAEADALLLPSRIESIPVVFSDAMKAGLPVVAMPVGDLPRLLGDGSAGVLARSVDADAFAAAVAQLVSMPDLAPFSAGVAAQATTFSLPRICAELVSRLLAERPA